MTVTRNITDVFNGVVASGDIIPPTRDLGTGDGTPSAITAWLESGIYGGDSISNTALYSGFRMVTGGIDLSSRNLIGWQAATLFASKESLETFANGGMRIVFDDGANWSSYIIHGGDIGPFLAGGEGAFANFSGFGANDQSTAPAWWLDRDNRSPYASSGTVDWSNITHIELHFKPASSCRVQYVFGRFATAELSTFTGIVTNNLFSDMRQGHSAPGVGFVFPWHFRPAPKFTLSSFQASETMQVGIQVGDGVTQTTLTESNFSLSAWGTADDYNASTYVPPNTSILIDTPRLVDINQSPTDNIQFTDFLYSSTSTIGWRVRGNVNGISLNTRGTFVALEQAVLGHGSYINCTFQDCIVPVEITSDTGAVGVFVRDSRGILISTGAGDYSSLDIRLVNNTAHDVEAGLGGVGTYDITGITVNDGYTLKLHNNSPTNAITYIVERGITTATSTAGGAITVINPALSVDVSATNLLDGTRVRLYNTTSASEIDNSVVSGGFGYSINLSEGVEYTLGDSVVLLATYHNSGVNKRVYRNSFTLNDSDITITDFQLDWEEPNVLSINGDPSNIVECTTDFIEVEVEVNDDDNTTSKSRIAAFLTHAITTEGGIRNWVSLDGEPIIDYSSGSEALIDSSVAEVTIVNVKQGTKLLVEDTFVLGWSDGVNRANAVLGASIVYISPSSVLEIEDIRDIKTRMDLNTNLPNTYNNNETEITNSEFTLTKVNNGDGTFTVVRS